jgi:hypothetical protein
MHSGYFQTQLAAGAGNATGDLATVGNEDFFNHVGRPAG